MSIRIRITLWFSIAMILIAAISYVVVLRISGDVIQKNIQDNLKRTVEINAEEIEFYESAEGDPLFDEMDYYLDYDGGYLLIDNNFLDDVNEVYTSLCDRNDLMMYGENPIAKDTMHLDFKDEEVQIVNVGQVKYYIYDKNLHNKGLRELWLRGIVSEQQGAEQLRSIARAALFLFPSFVLIAIIGGYLITRRALLPIDSITKAASEIGKGEDLHKRIDLGEGTDELHRLADCFNDMFERLEVSFMAEKQFTSDASHELRTPMTVIMAQCELTLEKERTAEEYEDALYLIQRQGRKMTRLINDLLDFTRLELKSEVFQKDPVDLSELVESICSDMQMIGERGITLEYEVKPELYVDGNVGLLTRLLSNLIGNAYRYGNEQGHIWVSLAKKADYIALTVRDDGIGISKEEQEKIFKRFYQVDSSHEGKGTGLGLSMVREIVKYHGAEITVSSEIGEGSTFVVLF